MSAAFIFPGQGSQVVGMGKPLADAFTAARDVFAEVDAALDESLTKIIWEGPSEKLTRTENAQPALLAMSLAVMRVLETEAGLDLARDARFVAGHSLGEYSAPAPWRRCLASSSTKRWRPQPKPVATRFVKRPTTTAADRWSSPGTRPRSSAQSRSLR